MFETLTTGQWISIVLAILLAISEILPFTSKVKANSLFGGIINIIKMFAKK